jgi:hypothetical protein
VAPVRLSKVVVIVIGSALIWLFGNPFVQRWHIQRVVQSLIVEFPAGTTHSDAQKTVGARYPKHTDYTSAECEKWSHMTSPAYISKGGPCIFGLVDVIRKLYLMEAGVEFRLIFGVDDRLVQLDTYPVYTFL